MSIPSQGFGSEAVGALHPAPWSLAQKVVTVAVTVLLAWVVYAIRPVPAGAGMPLLARSLVLLVLCIGPLSMVRSYEIRGGDLIVHRLLWESRIPLAGLTELRADPRLVSGSIRLFGNGGFFSTTGLFWSRKLGRYRMLLNDPSRAVLLRFPDRRVVVGPGDPARFIRDVERSGVPLRGVGV